MDAPDPSGTDDDVSETFATPELIRRCNVPWNPPTLPGTSPRLDVRIDLTEADPWGRQVIATAVFRDVMLSDDLDGMDYYEAVVPLSGNRRDVFRISLNGATSDR